MKKKNVVLITMDECKWNVLGCYGNEDAISTGIDDFSKDGITFENCFTTMPKCVPARTCLMTGRYCHTDGHRTLPGFEVLKGERNFVKDLKDCGYKTGMFGKNHTFMNDAMEENLDVFNKERIGLDVPWARREFEKDDMLFKAFYRGDFSNIDDMSDHHATQRACKFIEDNKENPFFTLINYNAPHPPYTDIKPFIDKIREKNIKLPKFENIEDCPRILKTYREVYGLESMTDDKWRKVVEAYYGLVAYVSFEINTVMQKLKDEGLYEDSLIIITSDHGDFAGEHGAVEKWDTMFYDCLTHIPLIVKLPQGEKAGERRDTLCEIVDIAPTIMQVLDMDIPDYMHGKSLIASIEDKNHIHKEEVFSEGGVEEHALSRSLHYNTPEHALRHPNYPYKQIIMVDHPYTMFRAKMVRTKEWKLIYRVDGEIELYDMVNDPDEFVNVAGDSKHKDIINEMILKLLNWEVRTETDYPRIEVMYS